MTIEEIEQWLDRELAIVRDQARAERVSVDQLRTAVNDLVLQTAARVEEAGDTSPVAAGLWQRLCRLVELEGRAHQELVTRRPRLLGNILANATASVNEDFWTRFRWDERVIALCKTCGAPQQAPANLRCCYCGGDIFKGLHR